MAQQHWQICDHYARFLFHAGQVAIVSGLILGILLAAATVIVSLRRPPAPATAELAPNPTPILDSIRAFIQAIAAAPTWLALFGGGILLVWMAAYTGTGPCPH